MRNFMLGLEAVEPNKHLQSLLGLVAFFGGALFLSAYLFVQSYRVNGSINALLLGPSRS